MRSDIPLQVIQEVLDKAADGVLAGHGKEIKVPVHSEGSVCGEADGRGMPAGLQPEEKAPVIELVFARLHAGGKFDKGKGGAYSFSGGLHGVGVSVTNALGKRMEVASHREGMVATLAFEGDRQVFWYPGNYSEYEEDKRKRLGGAAERPHSITYRKLTRA